MNGQGLSDPPAFKARAARQIMIRSSYALLHRSIMRYPGIRKWRGRPAALATASAAIYPLRTAPSMVAGQPDRVQSPARKKFANWRERGRSQRFEPRLRRKRGPNFFDDLRFLKDGILAAGKNSASSRNARAITSPRGIAVNDREALTTSCT